MTGSGSNSRVAFEAAWLTSKNLTLPHARSATTARCPTLSILVKVLRRRPRRAPGPIFPGRDWGVGYAGPGGGGGPGEAALLPADHLEAEPLVQPSSGTRLSPPREAPFEVVANVARLLGETLDLRQVFARVAE